MTLADLFVRAGLASSHSDARRLAAQGGLSLNDERVTAVDVPFQPDGAAVLLRRGVV
jgi:tyrosyl-tRNA synthetase